MILQIFENSCASEQAASNRVLINRQKYPGPARSIYFSFVDLIWKKYTFSCRQSWLSKEVCTTITNILREVHCSLYNVQCTIYNVHCTTICMAELLQFIRGTNFAQGKSWFTLGCCDSRHVCEICCFVLICLIVAKYALSQGVVLDSRVPGS